MKEREGKSHMIKMLKLADIDFNYDNSSQEKEGRKELKK